MYQFTCLHCGAETVGRSPLAKTCSGPCRAARARQRKHDERVAAASYLVSLIPPTEDAGRAARIAAAVEAATQP